MLSSFVYLVFLQKLYASVNSEFRRALAQIVIALHHNQIDIVKSAYKQATTIYSPSYVGKLHNILARHNYKETLKITPEAKMFLSGLKL